MQQNHLFCKSTHDNKIKRSNLPNKLFCLLITEMDRHTMQSKRQVKRGTAKMATYRLRLSKNSPIFISVLIFCRRLRFAASLLFIPSFVEDNCKSLCRCRIIDIPFTKLGQWSTLVLYPIFSEIKNNHFMVESGKLYGLDKQCNLLWGTFVVLTSKLGSSALFS